MRERAKSQTGFVNHPRLVHTAMQCSVLRHSKANDPNQMLATITQTDAEYTAAIAEDGKRDSVAMKTISLLGVVFLPGTFVATLFSIDMFDWGTANYGRSSSLLSVSR